jgi:hypothetical protein
MSCEGYEQYLCANGHLRVRDCWDEMECNEDGPFVNYLDKCDCGAPTVFHHSVDTTNDEGNPYPFEIDIPAKIQACNLGYAHTIREATYKIPSRNCPIHGDLLPCTICNMK